MNKKSKELKNNYEKNETKVTHQNDADNTNAENIVVGRNAVLELLRSGRDVDKIFIAAGNREGSVTIIAAEALKRGIPLIEAERVKLNALAGGVPHQGVAAVAAERNYADLDDIFAAAEQRNEKPLVILADGVEDPHNLGAMIRVAECAGAHGLIIPKRRAAGLTHAVNKASAGALEHLPVVKTPNLAQMIELLKEKGLWIFAAESGGALYTDCDFDIPCAVIFGGEDGGVSRLLKDKSDYIISIPMLGKVGSLNVSNAAAAVLFEIVRQRNKITAKGRVM
jgi:23S rRNA (guanosine2251-2'-O)-methyltransferase